MIDSSASDQPHPATLSTELLLRDCDVRHERRRGPGGQHRNKTESAVVLRHRPTGIEGQAAERRSLVLAVRSAAGADTSPSPLWKSRCHGGKIGINEDHDDFPILLAEALDVLHARQAHVPESAEQLGCTPSQLVKLLKKEPRALLWLNEERRKQGFPALE